MVTLDRGDAHLDDAGGWPEACAHMGVFLAWAARRGLAAPEHVERLAQLRATPGAYLVRRCDTKLFASDFVADERLIRTLYSHYLPHYANLVRDRMGSSYVLGLDDALLATIDAFLDDELGRLAPEHRSPEPRTPEPLAQRAEPTPPTTRVRHPKFGLGVVLARVRDGRRERVTVEFEAVGRKTILAEFLTELAGDD
jgi:hypothetical protein